MPLMQNTYWAATRIHWSHILWARSFMFGGGLIVAFGGGVVYILYRIVSFPIILSSQPDHLIYCDANHFKCNFSYNSATYRTIIK